MATDGTRTPTATAVLAGFSTAILYDTILGIMGIVG